MSGGEVVGGRIVSKGSGRMSVDKRRKGEAQSSQEVDMCVSGQRQRFLVGDGGTRQATSPREEARTHFDRTRKAAARAFPARSYVDKYRNDCCGKW